MNKNKTLYNLFSIIVLFLLISFVFLVIYFPYYKTDTAFYLGWDMTTIYSSNFENLRTMISEWRSSGTLPYWSWANFLGNDFYSSKLFYFNDFWEYFFVFTDLPYTKAIVWMTYLRFLTAGFSFYAYGKYNRYSNRTSILSALLFTFSAYLLQIMRDPFFASFISFLPLYFLSIDRYIKENKHGFFIFMVFFMYFNSYYLFYMTSLFTVLYFIWRYKKEHQSLKGMWPSAFKLIGYYIAGFLLSGFIVLPEVINVMNNSRVGERSATFLYESIVPYINYLTGLFTPTTLFAYNGNDIANVYLYDTPNHQLMAVYVWAGSTVALLFPQFFVKKEERKSNIIYLIVITLFSLVPILSSLMHGLSEPSFRWMANVTFFLIALCLPYMERPEMVNKKVLLISIFVIVALMAITPITNSYLCGYTFSDIREDYKLILYCIPTCILVGISMYYNKKNLWILFSVVELCIVSFLTYYGNQTQTIMTNSDAERMTTITGQKNEFNEWLLNLNEENQSSFYRVYLDRYDVYWGRGTNYNLDANIKGLMAYDSTYLASTNDLILLDEENVVDYLPWTFYISNPDIMTLVSTKYAIISEGTECPFNNGELIGHYASWELYENLDYINLGKTYTGIMTYEDYDSSDSSVITQSVICHAEDYEEIQSYLGNEEVQCYNAVAEGNHVSAGIETTSKGFAVLSVPNDAGWTVTVNGKEVKTYSVNGGMTGIALEAGNNDIQMYFTPQGLQTGKCVSVTGCVVLIVLCAFDIVQGIKKRKDS